MTLRRKILFWIFLVASVGFLAVPSAVLFESLQRFLRTAPEDPGLRPSRTETVPHRATPEDSPLRPLRPGSGQVRSGRTGSPQPRFVRFSIKAPQAKAVYLAGDFNLWHKDRLALRRGKGGDWSVLLAMPPGRYRYRFVVDGKDVVDPANPATERVEEELVSVKELP